MLSNSLTSGPLPLSARPSARLISAPSFLRGAASKSREMSCKLLGRMKAVRRRRARLRFARSLHLATGREGGLHPRPRVRAGARLGGSEILLVGDRMGNNCMPFPAGKSTAKRSESLLSPSLPLSLFSLSPRMQHRGHKLPTS